MNSDGNYKWQKQKTETVAKFDLYIVKCHGHKETDESEFYKK